MHAVEECSIVCRGARKDRDVATTMAVEIFDPPLAISLTIRKTDDIARTRWT
jgi:hypothetical protein